VPATKAESTAKAAPQKKSRPKPGERRVQILQTLALLLQETAAERVTTAALAKKMQVSEAALYRHFASKAQMYGGLIDFIERSLLSLINQITTQEENGKQQVRAITMMMLAFAEKNPGMTRVLVGDGLNLEDERLQARINQLVDRLEMALKQACRGGVAAGSISKDAKTDQIANAAMSLVLGRWLRFAKTGFAAKPTENAPAQIDWLLR
jgi:TetR/AcrR family transcriptional regulator